MVIVGAVAYDPKVVTIWEIIKDFFEKSGCPMDFVFFSNYELQVEALKEGSIDVAWNSPLAWLDADRQIAGCRAIAMRDTDRDRKSHIIVRLDSGIKSLGDLRGKVVATGAKDSPQATLIPIGLLQREGLEPGRDFTVKRFDLLVGKHGDHIGGEKEAFGSLSKGEADASCLLDLNWNLWSSDGTIDTTRFGILATTDPFDHCVFAVRPDFPADMERKWLDVLFTMDYSNPDHKEMMDMEGLKEWLPGRTTGFDALREATQRQGYWNS